MTLDRVDHFRENDGGCDVTEAPSGHSVRFAKTVHREGEVVEFLAKGCDRGVFHSIIDKLFVDFVGEDEDFLFEGNFGQSSELVLGINRAGGIPGGVDDDHFGHRAHVLAKEFGG